MKYAKNRKSVVIHTSCALPKYLGNPQIRKSSIYERLLIFTDDEMPSIHFLPISWKYRFCFVFLQKEKCLVDKMQMI